METAITATERVNVYVHWTAVKIRMIQCYLIAQRVQGERAHAVDKFAYDCNVLLAIVCAHHKTLRQRAHNSFLIAVAREHEP